MEIFLTLFAVVLIVFMGAFCFFQIAFNAILKVVMNFFGISEE